MPFWVCETALISFSSSPSHSLPCFCWGFFASIFQNCLSPRNSLLSYFKPHPPITHISVFNHAIRGVRLLMNPFTLKYFLWMRREWTGYLVQKIVNHQTVKLLYCLDLLVLSQHWHPDQPLEKRALVKQRELIKVRNTVNTKHIITDFLPSDDKTVTHLLSFSLKWGRLTHPLPSIRHFAINAPGGTLLARVSHERRANVNSEAHCTVNIWL